jgi:hypothetical protein
MAYPALVQPKVEAGLGALTMFKRTFLSLIRYPARYSVAPRFHDSLHRVQLLTVRLPARSLVPLSPSFPTFVDPAQTCQASRPRSL